MNGTRTLRIAGTLTLVAALAAPGTALAKKKKTTHKTATPAPAIVVPHDYDAGGNGGSTFVITPGVRINLFDPAQVAAALGNDLLGQLGLPPLPPV